jgi:hypothetical protein
LAVISIGIICSVNDKFLDVPKMLQIERLQQKQQQQQQQQNDYQ